MRSTSFPIHVYLHLQNNINHKSHLGDAGVAVTPLDTQLAAALEQACQVSNATAHCMAMLVEEDVWRGLGVTKPRCYKSFFYLSLQ